MDAVTLVFPSSSSFTPPSSSSPLLHKPTLGQSDGPIRTGQRSKLSRQWPNLTLLSQIRSSSFHVRGAYLAIQSLFGNPKLIWQSKRCGDLSCLCPPRVYREDWLRCAEFRAAQCHLLPQCSSTRTLESFVKASLANRSLLLSLSLLVLHAHEHLDIEPCPLDSGRLCVRWRVDSESNSERED